MDACEHTLNQKAEIFRGGVDLQRVLEEEREPSLDGEVQGMGDQSS